MPTTTPTAGDVFRIEQYYLDCLSQASYLVVDTTTNRAAVVDPRRDVDIYLADAEAGGLTIEYVIETHLHADFVSGHLELAAATGATIVYGEKAQTEFAIHRAADGERLSLGAVDLEILATPGHTPESISIVVWAPAEAATPVAVLTGDTLFIGDVGRPDLLSSKGVSADELGHLLYTSVHDRLLALPDETLVYPAHGAGSACGKQLSTETVSTIGEERRTNYALQPMSADEFVQIVTEGQREAPQYFLFDAGRNREQHALLDAEPPPAMTASEAVERARAGAVILDTRDALDYAAGHIVGSINVGLGGRFAEFAGSVVDPAADIIVVTDPDLATEARVRLARIGYDNVVGAVDDVHRCFVRTPELVEVSSRVSVAQLEQRLTEVPDLLVIDVREPGERAGGVIPGSQPIPLATLPRAVATIDLDRPIVVLCAAGYRSSIAAGVLRAAGARDVSDLIGGYSAWAEWHAGA